jgi:hypothetical protein
VNLDSARKNYFHTHSRTSKIFCFQVSGGVAVDAESICLAAGVATGIATGIRSELATRGVS